MFDELLIGPLVGLGSRPVHGGALAAVEHAEVDAGLVDGPAHDAAQRVDLANDLPLGHATNGRVAAHLGHRIEVVGEQDRLGAHPRSGQCGLAAGMARSDDDDIVLVDVSAHRLHLRAAGASGEVRT